MQIKLNLSPIHFAVLFIQVLLDAVNFWSTCYKEIWANKFKRLTSFKFRSIIPPARCVRSQSSTSWISVPAVWTALRSKQRFAGKRAQKKHDFVLCVLLIWPILLQSFQVKFSLQLPMGKDKLTRKKRLSTKTPRWTYHENQAFWKKMGDLRNVPYRSQSRLSLDPRTNES